MNKILEFLNFKDIPAFLIIPSEDSALLPQTITTFVLKFKHSFPMMVMLDIIEGLTYPN